MSAALAIAGVTAVLCDHLSEGFVKHGVSAVTGTTVNVTTMAPDKVIPSNGIESTQLNIFLYQVMPNIGLRNNSLPSIDSTGRNHLTSPSLALDLYFLISAYGSEPLHREIVLGQAMQLIHEYPVFTRKMIRAALNRPQGAGTDPPSPLKALAKSDLADRVEAVKISPHFLNNEEMSKMWMATQSHFRPSVVYQVSFVIIEAQENPRPIT